jgi:hypothetical protein
MLHYGIEIGNMAISQIDIACKHTVVIEFQVTSNLGT